MLCPIHVLRPKKEADPGPSAASVTPSVTEAEMQSDDPDWLVYGIGVTPGLTTSCVLWLCAVSVCCVCML